MLIQETEILIEAMMGEATSQSDIQKQLLAAATLLADANEIMLEAVNNV